MTILVITKKWKNVNEAKFLGSARLIGEIENEKEYLVWQFYGEKDSIKKIFGDLLINFIEFNLDEKGGEINGRRGIDRRRK